MTAHDETGRSSAPSRVDVEVAACGGAAPKIDSIAAEPESPGIGDAVALSATWSDPDDGPEGCGGAGQTLAPMWRFVERPAGSAAALDGESQTLL